MNNFVKMMKLISAFDWEYIMFGCSVFLIPFHTVHQILSISVMENMGNKLSIYPVLIGLCLFLYRGLKKGE